MAKLKRDSINSISNEDVIDEQGTLELMTQTNNISKEKLPPQEQEVFQADQVLISLDNTNNSRGNIEGSKYESNIRNMELNKKDGVDQKSSLTTCQMKVSNKINQESQVFVMNLESDNN